MEDAVIIPESEPTPEDVEALRKEIMEATFMKVLIIAQGVGELTEDPTREEVVEFATRHVGKIWDDYQVFKAEQQSAPMAQEESHVD